MTRASKAGSAAIVGDGKDGSSARIAVAGLTLLITLLVGTARNSTARRDPATRSGDLKISVLVYNYAGSSANMLGIAEDEAARIFARAGVRLEWHECLMTGRAESADSTCASPMTPSELELRIIKRVKLVATHASADATGFTIGDLATVQTEPLLDLRTSTEFIRYQRYQTLGRVIAHEIGHSLLGPGHSSRGIMQAQWGEEETEFTATLDMVFTPDQERALRLAVKARATH